MLTGFEFDVVQWCNPWTLQPEQAQWVRYPAGPHHLSVMTRGHGLDSACCIPCAEKRNFTFTSPFHRLDSYEV